MVLPRLLYHLNLFSLLILMPCRGPGTLTSYFHWCCLTCWLFPAQLLFPKNRLPGPGWIWQCLVPFIGFSLLNFNLKDVDSYWLNRILLWLNSMQSYCEFGIRRQDRMKRKCVILVQKNVGEADGEFETIWWCNGDCCWFFFLPDLITWNYIFDFCGEI